MKSMARSVEDIGGFTREGFVLLAPKGARWTDAFLVTTNLFEVSPTDPWTLAATLGFVLLVAAVSAYLPARAVTKLDPARALRFE